MTYLGELKYFQLNKLKGSELQTFNENGKLSSAAVMRRLKGRRRKELCCAYLKQFCDKSSVHGVRFLSDNGLLKFEKIIWAIILLSTSICAIYVYLMLNERYQNHRIQTIVEDSVYPVFYIPFPSIAICTRYRYNWSKMSAAQVKFLPPNPSNATVTTFRDFFHRFEDFQFGKFQNFKGLEALELNLINNISIVEVMRFLTHTCEDLFGPHGVCLWRKQVYDCCELFTLQRTEIGFCQVFNSVIGKEVHERAKRDKYYPYRNSKSGEKSGLQVQVRINVTEHRPETKVVDGILLVMKQPDQWTNDWKLIDSNTDNKIAITPQLTDTQRDTRAVSPDARNCVFDDEVTYKFYKKIPGLAYWRGNCRTQCHHEYVMNLCHCTIPLLFPDWVNTTYPVCRPRDYMCLYQHEKIFRSERHILEKEYVQDTGDKMVCTCLNSCNALVFTNSITSFPKQSTNENISIISLDIYFTSDYMLKYRTILSYTFVELIGNFGGIIGLFLGASILSAFEVIYYLTVGLVVFIRRENEYATQFENGVRKFNVRPVDVGRTQHLGKHRKEKF